MKITLAGLCALFALLLLSPGSVLAQAAAPSAMAVQQVVTLAQSGVDPVLRSRIVSVYGTGTAAGIDTWWVIFYDPSVDSHGRAVCVQNGAIARTYEAKGGVVYGDTLTFAPSRVHHLGQALTGAQDYASEHSIAYDQVRVLLRLTTHDEALRWRIQLLNDGVNRGFVFVNASTGTFARYSSADHHHQVSGSGDSVEASANAAGNDIKNTFLGVGGDLQQFFTGERTVDR
jgi:hypothetical protein